MILVKKYNTKYNEQWDIFIKHSNNGTLFQTRKFLNYHICRNFIDHSLIFTKGQHIVALFPACIIRKNSSRVLYSHPGASYGGLVFNSDADYNLINETIRCLNDYCQAKKFASVSLIQTPFIYHTIVDFSLDYCLKWNGFKEIETYISHATHLQENKNIFSFLHKRKKRYINKLQLSKAFKIVHSNDLETFYPILLESKKNYDVLPTHSLDELKNILLAFNKKIILLLSFDKKTAVGGSLIFITNNEVGLVFYNVVLNNYKKTQLASYQLYNCLKICLAANLKYVDFGVSHIPQDHNPLTPKLSLIKFKEQFGAKGIMRHIYQKDYNFEK